MELNTKINDKVVVHSFLWKLSERVVSQGVNLLIQIVLARILFPNDFGSLAIMIAFINYANVFVQSGLSTAIIQKKDLDMRDVATAYTSSLGIAAVFYIVLFFLAPYLSEFYNNPILCNALRVLSLVLFLNAINSVQSAIFMRRMEFKIIFLRTILAVPISGAAGILMAYLGFGLWSLVTFNLLNVLIVVLVMNVGTDMKIFFGFSKNSAVKIYNFSSKIILSNLVSGFYDFIRTMLIGKRYSRNNLAYFDKANTYSFYLVSMVNTSISSVLLPTFSKAQDNKEELLIMARRAVKVTTFIMIPILVGVMALADILVQVILTNKWIACVPYLMLFCLLRVPGCIMNIDKQVYYALGRSELDLYYEIGILLLNLIFIYFMLPYGVWWIILGACCVEYIGISIIFIISSRVYQYTIKQRLGDLVKTILASGIMYICIVLSKDVVGYSIYTLPLQILLGIFIYACISYLLKNDSLLYIVDRIKNVKKSYN